MAVAATLLLPAVWVWWGLLEPVAIYDSVFYLDMASNGALGNPNLVAPFAYRFPVPLFAEFVSTLTGVDVEAVFILFTGTAAWLLLLGLYALARSLGASIRVAVFVLGATVFSFVTFRFHLYWYALVDIEAYLLLLLSMWFLWTGRTWHCLAVSLIGLFFKEFLGIPGLLACLSLFLDDRRPMSRRVVMSGLAFAALVAFAAIPRLAIPVAGSHQFLDLTSPWAMIAQHFDNSPRVVRAAYSLLVVSLPLLLLLSKSRARRLLNDTVGVQFVIYYSALWVLAILGGAGIPRFMTYSLPWIVLLLARLRPAPTVTELLMAFGAIFLYNRPWLPVPNPGADVVAFVNFYGGHTASSASVMLWRTLEMGAWVAAVGGLRVALGYLKGVPSERVRRARTFRGVGHSASSPAAELS